jgi:nucleoside-diphosphate-sugar epimerase
MATILVTGAAGFIGSHVSEALLHRGDQVIGVDNFDPFYPRNVKERNLSSACTNPRFRLLELDLRDSGAILSLMSDSAPDAVIHLAAKAGVRPSIQDPAGYIEANMLGLQSLLSAIERRPVEHFVFASSSSVYGDRANPPFREEDRTDEPASPYAATKKAGETLCYTYHALTGIPVTCLRFFTVYGPRQRPDLAIHKFTRLIDAGQPVPFFGDGSTRRDYTYVEDTVAGILAALDNPSPYEIYNLGRSDPVSLSEMLAAIETALGKKAALDRMPDQPGDVRMTCANVEKAANAFGYAPKIDFEEGIGRFVAWWRNEVRV